jgi:hypothetical protein
MDTNTVEIYCAADRFSKKFDGIMEGHPLKADNGKRHRNCRFVITATLQAGFSSNGQL